VELKRELANSRFSNDTVCHSLQEILLSNNTQDNGKIIQFLKKTVKNFNPEVQGDSKEIIFILLDQINRELINRKSNLDLRSNTAVTTEHPINTNVTTGIRKLPRKMMLLKFYSIKM